MTKTKLESVHKKSRSFVAKKAKRKANKELMKKAVRTR